VRRGLCQPRRNATLTADGENGAYHGAMSRTALVALVGLAAAACGSSPAPTGSPPRATPTVRMSATAAPATPSAALAPEVQRIDILATGIGTFQLVAVPVAVIHNSATRSVASGVLVHLTPTRAGRSLTPLLTPALTLYPGQTLVVAANCTDSCVGADAASASATAAAWTPQPGAPLIATAGAFTCTVSCNGHGQWEVPITVGGPGLVPNEQVELFATCTSAGGRLVGGGQRTLLWPQSGGTLDLTIPVIVSARPTACQVGATTSN